MFTQKNIPFFDLDELKKIECQMLYLLQYQVYPIHT